MSSPTPIRSLGQAKVRTPGQARQTVQGSESTFSIVVARVPLWGFGTFANPQTNYNTTSMQGTSYVVAYGGQWQFNETWPAVYNTCTEVWSDSFGGSQTIVTGFTPYIDQTQPLNNSPYSTSTTTVNGSTSGQSVGPQTTGTITSIAITNTAITINYGGIYGPVFFPTFIPATPYTATYVATLSGSILNPTGSGPFNPSDATYGWAALTATCITLLGNSSIPAIPGGAEGIWTSIDQIAASPGYSIATNNWAYPGTIWEDIGAAAYGLPSGYKSASAQGHFIPPSILDVPSPSLGSALMANQGCCLCMKSTWNLNGAGWWNTFGGINPNPVITSQNDHAVIYSQEINLTNFASAGTVAVATAFPNPIPWPDTVTFNPSDVTAAIGSGNYGLLGFQAGAA